MEYHYVVNGIEDWIKVREVLTNYDTPINTQKYVLGEFHSN